MGRHRIVLKHEQRRTEILEVAQKLFYERGYEHTPVQDILDALGIAKGTLYHYFRSKDELLEALTERAGFAAVERIRTEVERRGGSGLERLRTFLALTAAWKTAARDTYVAMTRSLYSPRNAFFRQRLLERGVAAVGPVLGAYIRQGVDEGLMRPSDLDLAAEMVLRLQGALGERTMPLVHGLAEHPENADLVVRYFALFHDAVERLLGAPTGSLPFDETEFRRAFASPERKG